MSSPALAASARTHNGYRWELAAAAPPELDALLARFPSLDVLPGVRTLKSNHFRTVFHLPEGGPAGPSIAKVYRYTSRWDRIRYRFLRHRARQEWTALERFRELGLPTARALAVADLRRGGRVEGGGLFVSYLAGTQPLNERLRALEEAGDRKAAGELLVQTGKLVRAMHDRGVWHRDLHSGNLLVERSGPGLFIIDLHTCFFLRELARWQRRGGLAKLIVSLGVDFPPADLHVLVDAYGPEALLGRGTRDEVERVLLAKAQRLRRKRVKSRTKRCFLPSTQFTITRVGGVRWFHLRAHAAADLEPLCSTDPPGRVLKESSRGWVAAAALGSRPVCVKHRRYSILEGLQALVESHRLRRAYAGGHALSVRGIPTPQVIALRERRRLGLVREAHVVTELIDDGVPLDELLLGEYWGKAAGREASREKHRLAKSVGALVRSLHDAGLYPHDLSPQNVVVRRSALKSSRPDSTPLVALTDLDHLYLWQRVSRRGRVRNLSEVANLPEGHVTTADRLRGLRAYARGEMELLSRPWVNALRTRLLEEHFRVLEHRLRKQPTPARSVDA